MEWWSLEAPGQSVAEAGYMGHRCPAIFFWHLEVSAEMESPYEKHLCQHVDAEHLPAFVPLPRVYFGFPPLTT